MSLLIFTYRRQYIIRRKADLNMKLLELQQRQLELQSYASSIADSTVSLNDLMNSPASMFNRMSIFMVNSHQFSMSGAQQKFGPMVAMAQAQGAFANLQPQMQQQYQQMMFKNLYDQERERFSKVEQQLLHKEDTKIQQQIAQIQTQLTMLDSEEKNVTEAESKAAEASAPKYVA